MGVRPLGNRILVRREEAEKKTPGGLLIPETAQEKPQRGEVIAAGPGKRLPDGNGRQYMEVTVGDTILFTRYAGNQVEVDGEELLMMTDEEVLGIVS